jgi:hypothetical protein
MLPCGSAFPTGGKRLPYGREELSLYKYETLIDISMRLSYKEYEPFIHISMRPSYKEYETLIHISTRGSSFHIEGADMNGDDSLAR